MGYKGAIYIWGDSMPKPATRTKSTAIRFSSLAALIACGLGAAPALASSDYTPPKVYALIQGDLDNTVPFLAPTNDSRATLLMLLADAGVTHPRLPPNPDPAAKADPYAAQTPLDLTTFASVFDDRPEVAASASDAGSTSPFIEGQGDRCRSNDSGAQDYLAALKTSKTPAAEQKLLGDARAALACGDAAKASVKLSAAAIRSTPGKDFATYLTAAAAFYSSDFAGARAGFASLANSTQPWVKEAALYMVARVDMNAAQIKAYDEFGDLSLKDVDTAAVTRADAEFRGYLHDYPQGTYVVSARGLLRRVAWLGDNHAKLADAFGEMFTASPKLRNVSAVDLAYEADGKLLTGAKPAEIHEPRLLATIDLMKMRREAGKPAPLSRGELEAQRPLFTTQKDLYDYLLAAYAFYDEDNAAAALKLVNGAAAGPHMSYVRFSQVVLKGLALEALHKTADARAHWLSLIPVAEPVLQRPAAELALAENYERGGDLATVFATGSPIRVPTYRETLLAYTAGPDLLRQRATAADAPAHERAVALYVLLFKELTRGRYQAFLDDSRLLPAKTPTDNVYDKLAIGSDTAPALGDFSWAGAKPGDDFACPSIQAIATALVRNPHAERSLICLGEFIRAENYENFLRGDAPVTAPGTPAPPVELASSKTLFPGIGVSRLDIYKAIIADPKAETDVRAYALYRAVNCWAPSGSNGCDSSDAPKSQRKQWFEELRTKYRDTRWAGMLKYYW